MNNKIVLGLIFAPMLALLIWVASINISIASMNDVKIRITGYDPRDLFRGHYIEYTIDWNKTDCSQFAENRCPIENFAYLSDGWRNSHRFYIPEQYASKLDEVFRNSWGTINDKDNGSEYIFEVIYAYKNGLSPKAKQLLINGKDWRELIKN